MHDRWEHALSMHACVYAHTHYVYTQLRIYRVHLYTFYVHCIAYIYSTNLEMAWECGQLGYILCMQIPVLILFMYGMND